MSSSMVGGRERRPRGTKSKAGELMDRAAAIIDRLEKGSPFFGSNEARQLPRFKDTEVHRGELLGQGEFSTVREVVEFEVQESCKCVFHNGTFGDVVNDLDNARIEIPENPPEEKDGIRQDSQYTGTSDSEDDDVGEDRGYMKDHCFREGSARYAVKQLQPDLADEQKAEAIVDISMEAKFLAVLSHSNIVKMRGTGGVPCHEKFFLVLDRLYDTLEEKIDIWAAEKKKSKGILGILGKDKDSLNHLLSDRLLAALDIARAMNYLHKHNIMYRDLKPANIGFDVRGDAKIFDFGLAKELLPRDMTAPDQFRASGLTGSRRYMSPEVAMCKPYGPPADEYSFSIVLWEMFALKVPFAGYDCDKHAQLVVIGGKRPKINKSWPIFLRAMMEEGWADKPSERQGFQRICDVLRGELMMIEGSMSTGGIANRSSHLLNQSHSSRRGI